MKSFDPVYSLTLFVILITSIGFHELCHAIFADMAGDPTPRENGRITLNPFAHFDGLGLSLIAISSLLGVGFGYGLTPITPSKMKNPRWDYFACVLAGPVSNLLIALLFAVVIRFGFSAIHAGDAVVNFAVMGCFINISLFLFNLIPIGPLDGATILGLALPPKAGLSWKQFNQQFGLGAFIVLILCLQTEPFQNIFLAPSMAIFRFLTGLSLN